MAHELKMIFSAQDKITSTVRKITREVEKLNRAMEQSTQTAARFNNAMNRQSSGMNRVTNTINRNTTTINNNTSSIVHNTTVINNNAAAASRATGSFNGLRNTLLGVAGAYLSVQGASKLFNATIGSAMKLEASTVAIDAIFNDKAASKAYMDMVKNMSVDSPVLSQSEMLSSSKGLIGMTKDVKELGKAWSIVEKLMVLAPEQGTQGAAFALKEMWQGDNVSMQEQFGLNKTDLNRIKKLGVSDQITEINKLLGTMGITDKAVERMGATSAAAWNGVQERFESFMQVVGSDGNTTLGAFFKRLNGYFDDSNAIPFANKLGSALDATLNFGIKAVESIGKVRDAINSVKSKAAELKNIFATDGASGLVGAILGENAQSKFDSFVGWLNGMYQKMKPGLASFMDMSQKAWTVISDVITNGWTYIKPVIDGLLMGLNFLGSVFATVFNTVIAPAFNFVVQLFSTLWSVAKPVLQLLGIALKSTFGILQIVWDTVLGPFVNFLLTGVKNAFDTFSDALSIVGGWFNKLSGWISTAYGHVSNFADMLKKVKVPDWLSSIGGGTMKFVNKMIPGNYHGISNVPYDGYTTRLHKNERVLTAQENKEYSEGKGGSGGGVVINIPKIADVVNASNPQDVDELLYKMAKVIEKEALQLGL